MGISSALASFADLPACSSAFSIAEALGAKVWDWLPCTPSMVFVKAGFGGKLPVLTGSKK